MIYATETLARQGYVNRARSYNGTVEGSGKHAEIRSIYNSISPRPRGYAIQAADDWCAAFVSAMGWAEGHKDWPFEVSVPIIVAEAKRRGIWRNGPWAPPGVGAWIVYDWNHSGGGDHIGIVAELTADTITSIEGNYSNSVKDRTIGIGDVRILGFVDLPFTGIVSGNRPLRPGDSGSDVLLLQVILKGAGYYVGQPDGAYDEKTTAAVMDFQLMNALQVDGKAGPATQAKIRSGDVVMQERPECLAPPIEAKEEPMIYKTIDEVPAYAKATVSKLVQRNSLEGIAPDNLGLTDDLIRMLVINDREGLYGKDE